MDQARIALAWIKKHHFWLLCGVAVLAGAGSWYMASAALAKEFDSNSKVIKAEFSSSTSVRTKQYHANKFINDQQLIENRRLADKVRELWAALYDRQREEVLKWPEQIGADFVQGMNGKQFGDAVRISLRQRYQDYIEDFYPELPAIVGALPYTEGGSTQTPVASPLGGRPAAGSGEAEGEEDFIVQWAGQEYVRDQLNLATTPSTIRMWVTQEDLWVYVTLLRAVAAVNTAADADRYANAAIRDIDALQVGKPAAAVDDTGDRIYRPETTIGAATGLGGVGEDDGDGIDSLGGGGDGFAEGGEQGDLELLSGRYLDAEGRRMPASEDDFRYGTEFKRLPVRLELGMDQRWLPLLITELSNAPLQVEVTEVRINPGLSNSLRKNASSDETNTFSREPNLVDVVMRGTVYIYNPVDEEALSVGDDNEA